MCHGLMTDADVATTRLISSSAQFDKTAFLSDLLVSSPVYAAALISLCWLNEVVKSSADFLESTYIMVGRFPISCAISSTDGVQ